MGKVIANAGSPTMPYSKVLHGQIKAIIGVGEVLHFVVASGIKISWDNTELQHFL